MVRNSFLEGEVSQRRKKIEARDGLSSHFIAELDQWVNVNENQYLHLIGGFDTASDKLPLK